MDFQLLPGLEDIIASRGVIKKSCKDQLVNTSQIWNSCVSDDEGDGAGPVFVCNRDV